MEVQQYDYGDEYIIGVTFDVPETSTFTGRILRPDGIYITMNSDFISYDDGTVSYVLQSGDTDKCGYNQFQFVASCDNGDGYWHSPH